MSSCTVHQILKILTLRIPSTSGANFLRIFRISSHVLIWRAFPSLYVTSCPFLGRSQSKNYFQLLEFRWYSLEKDIMSPKLPMSFRSQSSSTHQRPATLLAKTYWKSPFVTPNRVPNSLPILVLQRPGHIVVTIASGSPDMFKVYGAMLPTTYWSSSFETW